MLSFITDNKKHIFFLLLLLFTLSFGATVRFYNLETLPVGFEHTELETGISALNAEGSYFSTFLKSPFESFFLKITSLSFNLFGVSINSLRIFSALIGALTLPGLFLLLRSLAFSFGLSLLGTFMFSFSFWHLHFSRTASREILIPCLLIYALVFVLKGLKSESRLWLVSSGTLVGIILHVSFFFFPALFFFLLLFLINFAFQKLPFRKNFLSLLFFLLPVLLLSLPFLLLLIKNSSPFLSYLSLQQVTFVEFFKELKNYLDIFFIPENYSKEHLRNLLPLIPLSWSIIFVFGFIKNIQDIFSFFTSDKKSHSETTNAFHLIIVQSLFWTVIVSTTIFSKQNPNYLLILNALPAIIVFCLLPLKELEKLYSQMKNSPTLYLKIWRWNIMRISIAGIFVAIVFAGFSQVYLYFDSWATSQQRDTSLDIKQHALGRTIKQIKKRERNFLILSQEEQDLRALNFVAFPEILDFEKILANDILLKTSCDNSLFVFQNQNDWLQKQLQEKCPLMSFEEINSPYKINSFWIMK